MGDRPDNGQFWQCGAEIVGPRSAAADGEIIAMAMEGLSFAGAREPAVTVGHVGLMWDVLRPFGLSGRVNLFLVNSVGKLTDGADGALAGTGRERPFWPVERGGSSSEAEDVDERAGRGPDARCSGIGRDFEPE